MAANYAVHGFTNATLRNPRRGTVSAGSVGAAMIAALGRSYLCGNQKRRSLGLSAVRTNA